MTSENLNSSATQNDERSVYSKLYEISIDFETHWGQEGWSIESCLEKVEADLKPELFRRLLEIDLELSNKNRRPVDKNDYKNRFPQWEADVKKIIVATNLQESVSNTEIIANRIGTRIGHYRFGKLIGRGGMGAVHEGFDESLLGRKVAIKALLVDSKTRQERLERQERFQWETRLLGKLPGTAFANAYASVQEGENIFLVMEYIDGVDLRKFVVDLRRRKQSVSCLKALRYIREIAENLQVIHQLGIVHRDIKPENIMLNRAGKIRILDLGLGTLTADSVLQDEMGRDQPEAIQATKSGSTRRREVMGSPAYMPPDVFLSEAVDTRSDLYCLGGTFFFLLTNGILPSQWFDATVDFDEEPPSLKDFLKERKISLPRDVFAILSKLLQKDLTKRYQTATEVCDDLDAAINRRSSQAVVYRRLKALNATLSGLVVLLFGLYYFCVMPHIEKIEAIRHYQAAQEYFDLEKYSPAFEEIKQVPEAFIPKIGNDYYLLRAKIKKSLVDPSRSRRIAERLYLKKIDFEVRDRNDLEDAKADLADYISAESTDGRRQFLADAYRRRSEINLALAAYDSDGSANEISDRLVFIKEAQDDVDSAIQERKNADRRPIWNY